MHCTPSSWLMLYIVAWQFCCSSEGPKGLGHEYRADRFTRHAAHHLRARFVWHVPWLVRVFQHLPKNVWPSARGPSVLKAQKEVCISCSSHYSTLLVYLLVKPRSSSRLTWLVQQGNTNDLHATSFGMFLWYVHVALFACFYCFLRLKPVAFACSVLDTKNLCCLFTDANWLQFSPRSTVYWGHRASWSWGTPRTR